MSLVGLMSLMGLMGLMGLMSLMGLISANAASKGDHLHILTFAHLHICTFAHLHILTFSHSHINLVPFYICRVSAALLPLEGVGQFGGASTEGEVVRCVRLQYDRGRHLEAVKVARERKRSH